MRVFSVTALAAMLVAAACGGAATGGTATRVAVTLSDKDIALSETSVPAGKVTFAVKNGGTLVHSMVVIKTNLDPAKLPVDPKDPGKVEERGSVGTLSQTDKGLSKELTLDLTPGKYVLVCNEPAHYLLGMRLGFTVQ